MLAHFPHLLFMIARLLGQLLHLLKPGVDLWQVILPQGLEGRIGLQAFVVLVAAICLRLLSGVLAQLQIGQAVLQGIYLIGGGAEIKPLCRILEEATSLPALSVQELLANTTGEAAWNACVCAAGLLTDTGKEG